MCFTDFINGKITVELVTDDLSKQKVQYFKYLSFSDKSSVTVKNIVKLVHLRKS